MITEIKFYDLARIKKLKPCLDTIVISVLDLSERNSRPKLGGFKNILSLTFEDTYEECKLASAGSWPDSPTDAEHALFCQSAGEKIPTISDAMQISSFLQKHHFSEEPVKLAVHCYAGISRSAAIAQWASAYFWVPLTLLPHQSIDYANPRLIRLLNKSVGRL